MAKTKMICPFSRQMCRECPQYRGRHYYLCFNSSYRGHVGEPQKNIERKPWSRASTVFELPVLCPPSPKWLVLDGFAERRET